MKKIFFIDRDGTINVEKGYVHKSEDLEFIPGSLEALQRINQNNAKIYIVTNQAGIAKGLYSEKVFQEFNQFFINILKENNIEIQDVLYCPHHPDAILQEYKLICECRKPGNLLLKKVLEKEGVLPEEAVMIGDRNTDIEAAKSIGVESYLVLTGYGMREKGSTQADFVVSDLQKAVDFVLLTINR
ncbi:MAG: HAD family hydrolase [Deltaproteobacteria bacterium]|nr:MAG: HAD family hydrolase [Deltaproteobacteria bacterium]